jgi:hypothetical protein
MKHALYALVGLTFAVMAPFGGIAAVNAASVAPGGVPAASLADHSLVTKVQARCVRANRICRARWGGGPRFRSCMRSRGCGAARLRPGGFCSRQNRICRSRWGAGPRFRSCMRSRGC